MYSEAGRKIKFLRTKLFDYTQDYMAQKLAISQNAYCKIENGQVQSTYKRLQQIAAIFEMKVEDMLNVNEKIVLNSDTNTTDALYNNMHNHNNVTEIRKLYEQLLKEQKEKYEAQIELLKLKVKFENNK